ncbi:MAG: hypothetical protein WCJ30_18855 [Deltaproteobacteria bacterium]
MNRRDSDSQDPPGGGTNDSLEGTDTYDDSDEGDYECRHDGWSNPPASLRAFDECIAWYTDILNSHWYASSGRDTQCAQCSAAQTVVEEDYPEASEASHVRKENRFRHLYHSFTEFFAWENSLPGSSREPVPAEGVAVRGGEEPTAGLEKDISDTMPCALRAAEWVAVTLSECRAGWLVEIAAVAGVVRIDIFARGELVARDEVLRSHLLGPRTEPGAAFGHDNNPVSNGRPPPTRWEPSAIALDDKMTAAIPYAVRAAAWVGHTMSRLPDGWKVEIASAAEDWRINVFVGGELVSHYESPGAARLRRAGSR